MDNNFNNILERHYRTYANGLVKRLQNRSVSLHDAEDIVQESYTRMLQYQNSFDGKDFGAWAATILRNCVLDAHRDRVNRGIVVEPDDTETEEPVAEIRMLTEQVQEYITNTLQEERQFIAVLYFLHGYSYDDIRKVTATSKPHLRKIIQRIREEISYLIS